MYGGLVIAMIALFSEETYVSLTMLARILIHVGNGFFYSMFDRRLPNPRPFPRPASNIRRRFENLVGITGHKMAKYRARWADVSSIWFKLIWRPHLLGIIVFEVCTPNTPLLCRLITGFGIRLRCLGSPLASTCVFGPTVLVHRC